MFAVVLCCAVLCLGWKEKEYYSLLMKSFLGILDLVSAYTRLLRFWKAKQTSVFHVLNIVLQVVFTE